MKNSLFIFNGFPIHVIIGLFYLNNYIFKYESEDEDRILSLLLLLLHNLEEENKLSTLKSLDLPLIEVPDINKIILDLSLYKYIDKYLESRKSSFDFNDFIMFLENLK